MFSRRYCIKFQSPDNTIVTTTMKALSWDRYMEANRVMKLFNDNCTLLSISEIPQHDMLSDHFVNWNFI